MDYFSLAEQMLSVRARLSHLPAGEAVSDACGGELINSRRREAIERVSAALRELGEEDAHEYVRLQQKMLDALSEDTFD